MEYLLRITKRGHEKALENMEIVRQLKLWIKEIQEDPNWSNDNTSVWVVNTANEILKCDYD